MKLSITQLVNNMDLRDASASKKKAKSMNKFKTDLTS